MALVGTGDNVHDKFYVDEERGELNSSSVGVPKRFYNDLVKDPKLIEKLVQRQEFDDFKKKYSVERASPLRCPACSQYRQSGASLWGPKKGTTNEFVCRKCLLEWVVECKTKSNEAVFWDIREIGRSGPEEDP